MKLSMTAILASTVLFSVSDAARGGTSEDHPVIEIVTFKLIEGTDLMEFLNAAKATERSLQNKGAKIDKRVLSLGSDGLWSDVIHWESAKQATKFANEVMEDPEFAPFMSMIDPTTVNLRHSEVLWTME